MTMDELKHWWLKLQRRLGRRESSDAAIADLFGDLKHIPSAVWAEICQGIWDDGEAMPTPGDLKRRWEQWHDRHPEKQARFLDRAKCADCLEHGGFTIERERGVKTYEGFIVCACPNGEKYGGSRPWKTSDDRVHHMVRLSREQAITRGMNIAFPTEDRIQAYLEESGGTVRLPREIRDPSGERSGVGNPVDEILRNTGGCWHPVDNGSFQRAK
jgi:hypothetical protein